MGVYRGKVLGIRQTSRIERIGEVEGCLPQRSGQPFVRRGRNRFAYLGIAHSCLYRMGSRLLKVEIRVRLISEDMARWKYRVSNSFSMNLQVLRECERSILLQLQ